MSTWFSNSLISNASSSTGSSLRSPVSAATSESQSPIEIDEQSTKKTIYLIRHAESEENVKMHGLQEVGTSLLERRMPTSENMTKSMRFIYSNATGVTNSDLSPQGKKQIKELFQILESDSQKNRRSVINDVELIGHSPLIRAKDTCYGAFGLDKNDQRHENVVELVCLAETTAWETLVQGRKNTVHKRIEELEAWIESQSEATIALVGHSEYFMIMLGLSRAEKFWNCDVWQVQYQSGGRWSDLELKHRLDSSKPMGMM